MQNVIRGALLVFLVSSTGCTHIANVFVRRLANARLDEVTHQARVTVARADAVIACFKRPGGTCVAAEMQTLSGAAPLSMDGLLSSQDIGRAKGSKARALTLAKGVLEHPVQGQIVQLFNSLQGKSSVQDLKIDLKQLSDFSDKLDEATDAGAWDALAELTSQKYNAIAADHTLTDRDRAERLSVLREDDRKTAFIKAYMRAYFRNGKFIRVDEC